MFKLETKICPSKWRATSSQYSVSPGLLPYLREEKKEGKFRPEPQVSLSKDCSLSRPVVSETGEPVYV